LPTASIDSRHSARIDAESCLNSPHLNKRISFRQIPFLSLPAKQRAVPLTTIAAAWPLLLGMGVLMLGAGLQSTLLGVRATLEQFPTPTIGAVMSCYYVGYLLGTIAAPGLIRNVGHIRVFAALAAIASAATLFQAAFVNPIAWAATRLVTGLCFAGIYVVAESWLNQRATRSNRARLLAVYMVVLYVGLGAAQFLLVLANPRSPARNGPRRCATSAAPTRTASTAAPTAPAFSSTGTSAACTSTSANSARRSAAPRIRSRSPRRPAATTSAAGSVARR